MKKVLVTGANGYIGKHVVKNLLNRGDFDVYVSDVTYKGMDERATVVETSIFSGDKDIYEKMGKPDILIHLAWRDGFIHNSKAHMLDLSKHVNFLECMIDGGLKSLSVMGSMHEVGYWEGEIKDDTPCNPLSMYGIAKNALRQTLTCYCKDKDIAFHWMRGYYIFGDDKRGSSIFAKISQAVEDGKTEFPFTSGKNRYDFINIMKLADMIVEASIQNSVKGVINVCSGMTMTLSEKVESYIRDNNWNIKLQYGAYPDREYDSPCVWGNTEKIEKVMKDVGKDIRQDI